MRSVAVIAVVLAACSFRSGTAPSDSGSGSDAPHDAPPIDDDTPMPDAQLCFGHSLVTACLDVAPDQSLTLTGNFDTGSSSCTKVLPQTTAPALCVVAGTDVTVTNFVATGTRALVIIGTQSISVATTLDVSSSAARTGAAANTGSCNAGAGAHDRGGGGGGGGGGFGMTGAIGGKGDTNDNFPPTGSATPGAAGTASSPPAVLRGGCPGGDGGAGDMTANAFGGGGAGGAGGGAVYLISPHTITIDGAIYASGAGGHVHPNGGGFEEGGGGGGAGGMIGLDAPAIAINGRVVANGGAGAGGGGNVGGAPGGDGTTLMWNAVAGHGAGDSTGGAGNGGDGTAVGATTPGPGIDAQAGGGGGGGGVGVIWIDGTVTGGAMVSPVPLAH